LSIQNNIPQKATIKYLYNQGSNLTLKSIPTILQVLFEATRKMKNQLTILLFALFPYNNV